MITAIYNVNKVEDSVTVMAIVEDCVQIYSQTLYDPPEYGPGLCEASFSLDGDGLPEDEDELIQYLESLNLDWEVLSNDEY